MCCLEKKKGDRKKRAKEGEGVALCLKRGWRRRGADRQERRFRGGGEGRLAGWLVGWRRGWVVSVKRGAAAGLITARAKVII